MVHRYYYPGIDVRTSDILVFTCLNRQADFLNIKHISFYSFIVNHLNTWKYANNAAN